MSKVRNATIKLEITHKVKSSSRETKALEVSTTGVAAEKPTKTREATAKIDESRMKNQLAVGGIAGKKEIVTKCLKFGAEHSKLVKTNNNIGEQIQRPLTLEIG